MQRLIGRRHFLTGAGAVAALGNATGYGARALSAISPSFPCAVNWRA